MSNTVKIRLLTVQDVEDYRSIRLAALKTAPEAFGSFHDIEASRPIDQHVERLRSSQVYGAYDGVRIVGMVGFRRLDGPKEAHKGFVWGFYVAPSFRNTGVGSALLTAVLSAVRGVVEQVTLTVVTDNRAAIALYESFGLRSYGTEPRALKSGDTYSDEFLMVLFLNR